MVHDWGSGSEDTSNPFSGVEDRNYRNKNHGNKRNDRMVGTAEDVEVIHTRNKGRRKRGGGVADVVMFSALQSKPPKNHRASPSPPRNNDDDNRRTLKAWNRTRTGTGTETYHTPTTSPSSPDKYGNKPGSSSSWFPMAMPSIGSLLSQPSDENPSTNSGSYHSGRSRDVNEKRPNPFTNRSGSMSPNIQNVPSNLTNPFSSRSMSASPPPPNTNEPARSSRGVNPFASRSPSSSQIDQQKKSANAFGSGSTSNDNDKGSPLASRSSSASPKDDHHGNHDHGNGNSNSNGIGNPLNSRSRSMSKSPTLGKEYRSYSRSPSPVYQRPSRKINTNQSEFHTLLSCAASPNDAQFLDVLELLATSKNPRKLAQMKLSDAHDWTALHIAFLSNPPLFLVYALLLVFPEGAKEVDNAGRLPLHLAAGSETSVCALKTLVRFNNEAICTNDDRGYIPLHLALLRDGNEEIPVNILRILLGQTVGSGEAIIRLGGTTPRTVRDGYMRNKEHLNLDLDKIQGGLLGVSRNAVVMKERKRREEMMRLTKKPSHEPLSRGFARNIQDVDSQDGDPLKHEHLSSLWANDVSYESDPFGDMELVEVNQFSSEVQHCLKQLAQWKKRYNREQQTEPPNSAESQIVNPATIPAPPYTRLPLHMAVRRNHKKTSQEGSNANRCSSLAPPPNQNEILRILIHAFPPSLMIKDAHNKTPLMTCLALVHHPAIHPVDLDMIELLLGTRTLGYKAAPRWLEDIDFFRQHQKSVGDYAYETQHNSTTLAANAAMIPCDETLPLHIAARESLPTSIVHTIYTSYPGAKYAQDERDCTPLHCTLQNLTGRTSLNLEMIYMLMDDKVLRIRNSLEQSIFDLLVANAKAGKLPKVFKDRCINHAERGKRVKVTTMFQPVFHQVIMDEVLGSGERKEQEFLSELYALPSTMRRQACATPSFQYVLLKELATGANAASIFVYGISLLTLAISFSSMVDAFISHRSDDDIMIPNAQKSVIFITNAYLSIHGLLYAWMTIRLNVSITESLANIWTWVTFISLLLSFVVTLYIGSQERSLGSIDVTDSHLITMSTIAIGTLWSAFVGYLARWWYGIGIFCASVVKVRLKFSTLMCCPKYLLTLLYYTLRIVLFVQSKMAKDLISPLLVLSMFTLAFMQMVYIIHTRNIANNQCFYEGETGNGEMNICSLWDSFKIVYLMVIGEGLIGAEASSEDATIILLLVFVVLVFIIILHTVSLTILNLQSLGVKDTMVESFWSPMLTHVLLIHQLRNTFCLGGKRFLPLTSRLEDMWDYMIVSYSDVDIKDTKWWYLQRDLGKSHFFGKKWFVRIVGFLIIPIWFCIGLATLGILWPPQIRQWIFQVGMDKKDLVALDESVDHSDLSQMTSLQLDLSKMKMMLYDRFQSMEDEIYRLRSRVDWGVPGSCKS